MTETAPSPSGNVITTDDEGDPEPPRPSRPG